MYIITKRQFLIAIVLFISCTVYTVEHSRGEHWTSISNSHSVIDEKEAGKMQMQKVYTLYKPWNRSLLWDWMWW